MEQGTGIAELDKEPAAVPVQAGHRRPLGPLGRFWQWQFAAPMRRVDQESRDFLASDASHSADRKVVTVLVTVAVCLTLQRYMPVGDLLSRALQLAAKLGGADVLLPLSTRVQQAGFTLVDDRSAQKPDIEITGEAFSAFGVRRGNLISCKARLELKAQKRTGEVLAVDRQTSVAADIAEQIAAKISLQNAALDMAERLLPKLQSP